jgi:hypothetical protein
VGAQFHGFICLPNTSFGTLSSQVSELEEIALPNMDLHPLMVSMERAGLYLSKLLPCLIQELPLFSYLRHKLVMSFFACCRARNIIKICRDILLLTARLVHNLKISFSSSEDIGFSQVPKITFYNMATCVIL